MSNHNKTMCDVYVHWMDGGEEKRAFVGSCNAVSKDVLCESLCAGGVRVFVERHFEGEWEDEVHAKASDIGELARVYRSIIKTRFIGH